MKSFTYIVQDKVGIHARPANKLISFLSGFKSKVTIKFGDKQANAKSLLNIMALEIGHNSNIEFLIEGEDEDKVLEGLPEVLKRENI